MPNSQISFSIIEQNPSLPDEDYYFQIICYETKFNDIIYCSKNNIIADSTNIKKNLKYIIKLMKAGKILGVGSFTIHQEIFSKKIKRKKYNNINILITENNYKKIFPQTELTKKITQRGINISIELSIKYTEKETSMKEKLKLMKRNFSYQEKIKYKKENSNRSSNINLTTSTTNINTFHNINNCYDNDNFMENNTNLFSSEKYLINSPSLILSQGSFSLPLLEKNNKKEKKNKNKNKKRVIYSKSYKSFNKKRNNSGKMKYSIFGNKKRCLSSNRKLNLLISQERSISSNNSNGISQSSVIDSTLIENNDNNEMMKNINLNSKHIIYNLKFNKNMYNKIIHNSPDYYFSEIENKKNKILNMQNQRNKQLFIQEGINNKLISTLKNYETKIYNNKIIVDKLKEKNDLLKYKEEILLDVNKEIIPIISKVKESKDIETNIFNLILFNYSNKPKNVNKNNNIEKYDKNLMSKIIKNVIQNHQDEYDMYLSEKNRRKLKYICDKYNIFGSIIEEIDE